MPTTTEQPTGGAPPTVTLSEAESKHLLAAHGVPLLDERLAHDAEGAVAAARELGFPVVAKLCGRALAHKTERGLVRLGLGDEAAVREAATDLLASARPGDGEVAVLVAPMVRASRELICGVVRDPTFGPVVMLGVGGVLAEAVADVVFRRAPLTPLDAAEMIADLGAQRLLGPWRGEPPVDTEVLSQVLVGLGALADAEPTVRAVDVNPLAVVDGRPVALDALVEVDAGAAERLAGAAAPGPLDTAPPPPPVGPRPGAPEPGEHRPDPARLAPLFEPRGVVVAGASSHPGKFGFVALHNLLVNGYEGAVYATNRDGGEVLGVPCLSSVDDVPEGACDLVFCCTPAAANPGILTSAAARGIRAAFVASAGYGELGEEGAAAERDLVATAASLGMVLAGPNGQGVVSTPVSLCAQIVAPYPPSGRIGVASQSGNFVSSFMNLARLTGVGMSRAVSAGNAAAVGVVDYLEYYASDPATGVGLAYVESPGDGAAFADRLLAVSETMPVVMVKGGATAGGQRAAASHTGALASDDRVFDGVARQAGIVRAAGVEEAYEAAATFAGQPLPAGPNVAVLTTAGGWGVLTADAIGRSSLTLLALPDDLRAELDTELPPRWSRNNPVDLAGGETRDTIPWVLERLGNHPDVHAVIYLGLGIQSNQARMARAGRFYPGAGLERIVAYHERQDRRFAEAAVAVSEATGKPVLVATELGVVDPDSPGPAALRAAGRLCYPSAERAVRALEHLWRYAQWRRRRGLGALPPPPAPAADPSGRP